MSMNEEAISRVRNAIRLLVKNEIIFVDVRNVKKAWPLRMLLKNWMRRGGHVYLHKLTIILMFGY